MLYGSETWKVKEKYVQGRTHEFNKFEYENMSPIMASQRKKFLILDGLKQS